MNVRARSKFKWTKRNELSNSFAFSVINLSRIKITYKIWHRTDAGQSFCLYSDLTSRQFQRRTGEWDIVAHSYTMMMSRRRMTRGTIIWFLYAGTKKDNYRNVSERLRLSEQNWKGTPNCAVKWRLMLSSADAVTYFYESRGCLSFHSVFDKRLCCPFDVSFVFFFDAIKKGTKNVFSFKYIFKSAIH